MKLNISHPEKKSLQVVTDTIEEGDTIYRSPHVGNVSNADLSLMFGIGAMGGTIQLELVDTIRGKDKYSEPKVAIVGLTRVVLASNKNAGRIVGSCTAIPEGVDQLNELGVGIGINGAQDVTLKQLHLDSLRQIVPSTVEVTPSTEYFAQIGAEAYEMILRESRSVLGRPLRKVDSSGRIEEGQDTADVSNVYGLGDKPNEGLLPPLEAMMAIEIVKKALDGNGSDGQIVHIAGADMIKYTKMEEVMQPAKEIADRVLSDLGIPGRITIDYVVPCRATILESADFDPVISENIRSQYDVMVARKDVEAYYE